MLVVIVTGAVTGSLLSDIALLCALEVWCGHINCFGHGIGAEVMTCIISKDKHLRAAVKSVTFPSLLPKKSLTFDMVETSST